MISCRSLELAHTWFVYNLVASEERTGSHIIWFIYNHWCFGIKSGSTRRDELREDWNFSLLVALKRDGVQTWRLWITHNVENRWWLGMSASWAVGLTRRWEARQTKTHNLQSMAPALSFFTSEQSCPVFACHGAGLSFSWKLCTDSVCI